MQEAIATKASKPIKNSTQSVFCHSGTIYSYGPHYPLAIFDGNKVYVNNTRYSNTTTRHKYHLVRALVEHGIPYQEISLKDMFTCKKR